MNRALAVAALFSSSVASAPAMPPSPPPLIHSITPGSVNAMLGGTVSVRGEHFSGLTWVDVGSKTIYPWQLQTASDTLLQFDVLLYDVLGPTQVTVWTNAGNASATFQVVPNDPPAMVGPTQIQNGSTATWWSAAEPGTVRFLLVNTTGQTVPVFGHSLLAYDLLLPVPSTSPVGVEPLSAPIGGLPVGFQLWLQAATLAPPGTDGSTLKVSNLLPVTVGA
ncbi:MAG: hypothetical protein ACF8XB_17040 [Planctomycetota bacterium JB042]